MSASTHRTPTTHVSYRHGTVWLPGASTLCSRVPGPRSSASTITGNTFAESLPEILTPGSHPGAEGVRVDRRVNTAKPCPEGVKVNFAIDPSPVGRARNQLVVADNPPHPAHERARPSPATRRAPRRLTATSAGLVDPRQTSPAAQTVFSRNDP
jgi:hypothetical protein